MVAEVICVGTELLLGQIVNTNAQYISQKLAQYGIDLYYQTVVGDNYDRLKKAIQIAYSRSDMIIFTGGLGPTSDDITKEVVSDFFNIELVEDKDTLKHIKSFFEMRKREMPEINKKQALVPLGSIILKNDFGTAPGVIIEKDEKVAILLPGPPFELKPMFENYVENYLKKFSNKRIFSKIIRFTGIGESSIEEQLKDIILNQTDPTIALYAKPYEVTMRISTKKDNQEIAYKMLDQIVTKVKERLEKFIYSYDDLTIEQLIVEQLRRKGLILSVAESCTGGLIANKITDVPGASAVFDRGFIVYSNQAKIDELGVPEELIKEYGAVSSFVAEKMAEGAIKNSNANISISTTGIAGPTGATDKKPIGLVYVGICYDGKTESFEYRFVGDRKTIKENATFAALEVLRKKIF